jgi:membrane protein insertase Oxa1/YidC/SpoIIIJ
VRLQPVLFWLDTLLIQPWLDLARGLFIELFELTSSVGFSLMAFSLVVTLITTPLYLQMEAHKAKVKAVRTRMQREVARIARYYTGRERYFYTRAVHRQFRYHPLQAVWAAGDLWLQVALFALAYRFLSHEPLLQGESFGLIANLGLRDGLLFGISLLPIVMTLANIASANIYTRDRRQRRYALLLALAFWILLRNSASGLVLYWTCNNLFSLLRNLIIREWGLRRARTAEVP